MLQSCDAEALERLLCDLLRARCDPKDPIAVDGKSLCGARRPDGSELRLLSAFLRQQPPLRSRGEREPTKSPPIKRLLEPLDLQGRVLTADAMHTQQETARDIVEEKKANALFSAKEKQKSLREDIAALGREILPPCVLPVR